ncbi:MAG: hypothetical protein ACLR9Q_07215 [Enterocloster sp.]
MWIPTHWRNMGRGSVTATWKILIWTVGGGKPLILKYHDIELHFGGKAHHGLHLIYSDDDFELSITADHEERSNHDENI